MGLYLCKHVLEFFGWKVECELYFDSGAARGISLRQGSVRIKHLGVRSLWLQQMVRDKVIKW